MSAALMRVLVVRADGLGDTILSLPLLHALRLHSQPVETSIVASRHTAGILRCAPLADHVMTIDAARAPLSEKIALARRLARTPFDAAICLSEKWWPLMWTRASGAPVRIGFDPGGLQPIKHLWLPVCLTDRVALPADPIRPSPLHEVERYLSLLSPLGVAPSAEGPVLVLPEAAVARARQRVAGSPAAERVALHLSPKWCSEGWRGSAVAALCRSLLTARPDAGVIVLEAPDAASLSAEVRAALGGLDGRVCFAGAYDILDWAALMSECRALITMDTAAVHLAAMLGLPVVDVFEAEHFEHVVSRWAPWRTRARTIRRDPIPPGASAAERGQREGALQVAVTAAVGEFL